MHKALKYCIYEKKKIRRLDHSINLVNELFSVINSKYVQKLTKPRSNKHTSLINKQHTLSISLLKDFEIRRREDSTSFVVTNLKSNLEYLITLSEWNQHECYLVCVRCAFCVHTFLCSCNDHRFKGIFCIHLHMLCTVKDQLPSFQPPINKRLMILNRLMANTTIPSNDNRLQKVSEFADLTDPLVENSNGNSFEPDHHSFGFDDFQCPSPASVSFLCNEKEECLNESEIPASAANSSSMLIKSYDNYAASFQNVARVLSTFSNQLDGLNQNPNKECFKPNLDRLYDHLLAGISIISSNSTQPTLASLTKKCRKRKLSESDKQLRLVANPKSKAGRKPLKQLQKPASPEKPDLIKTLLTPAVPRNLEKLIDSTEENSSSQPLVKTKKSLAKAKQTKIPKKTLGSKKVAAKCDGPKRKRGRPRKTDQISKS